MKYQKPIALLLFSFVIFLFSCKDTSSSQKIETSNSNQVSNTSATTNTANANTPASNKTTNAVNATNSKAAAPEAAQNALGVWHYTCGKGCAGGAGSAISCTTCGNLLAHNKAYHDKTNSSAPTATSSAPFMTQPVAQSGQNSKGVWHYTCNNGCAGGAGSASNCSSCGTTLAHNQAYH